MRVRLLMLSVLVVVTSPGVAVAQYNVPSQATGDSSRIEIASDQVIASDPPKKPLGYELGASLDFLTRDREPGADALKFTDIVFFRLHGLVELGRRAELFHRRARVAGRPRWRTPDPHEGSLDLRPRPGRSWPRT
jgi:hypothetical protein